MLGKILKFLFSLLCIVAVGFAIYCAATPGALDKLPKIASAAEEQTVYTSALEDLSKDANFSTNNYPTIADRYTVQVVQLAESAASELFIYTYEPSTNAAAHASSINISTAMNEDLNYKNYELKFLNNSGTLNKYLVKDFELKQDALRYYDISNIYRAWSSELGDTPGQNGNVVTEVPFAVGQLWTATTTDGKVNYSCTSTETIEITDKYVGYVRYPEGYRLSFGINEGGCDSHFVAFSTDKKIENLVEAEVFYKKQDIYIYGNKMVDGSIKPLSPSRMGEIETQYTTLDNTEEKTYEGNGWFHSKFTFKLIQSAEQFVAAETRSNIYEGGLFNVYSETKLTEDGLKNIQNKQWVLRFYESRYSYKENDYVTISKTVVSDVSILRLKFETNGVTYNLGVVDNKQSEAPEQKPDNETKVEITAPTWLQKVIDWFKDIWAKYKPYVIAVLAIIGALIVLKILSWLGLFKTKK